MPLTAKYFSDSSCTRECKGSIERTSNNVLRIRNESAGGYFTITTDIDLSGRSMRKTWKAFYVTWKKVYAFDNVMIAEIQDKGRLIEGYLLPLFSVSLSGRGHRIQIYSTDDFQDARAVQQELSDFLNITNISTETQE